MALDERFNGPAIASLRLADKLTVQVNNLWDGILHKW
jgi:hypothetical protein